VSPKIYFTGVNVSTLYPVICPLLIVIPLIALNDSEPVVTLVVEVVVYSA